VLWLLWLERTCPYLIFWRVKSTKERVASGESLSLDQFVGSPRIQTCHVTYHKSKSFQTNYLQPINQLLQLSLGGFNSHMAHCLLASSVPRLTNQEVRNTTQAPNGISQPLLHPHAHITLQLQPMLRFLIELEISTTQLWP